MFKIEDWGLISYKEAYQKQKEIVKSINENRINNVNNSILVVCEHPTVITIGKSGTIDNVLFDEETLKTKNVELTFTDRGGDVTLHNPNQLVGYPIFDLSYYKQDLHWFLREIEECIIELVALYGIQSTRVDGLTGVWIDDIDKSKQRKICAMGLHCSRWITSHGFALNVNNDLTEFEYIIPCGIREKEVTSIYKETNKIIPISELKIKTIEIFNNHFK
ncbi:MAG: lipoyl(octanoyl) transferase LipB [Candidatus Kapaibacteriota bacterium]|jgi:lipoyl(octanoyl) transferase